MDSHIIPRFVFDWLKRTSSTGYLRFGQQMNMRKQDGLKLPFLCPECEARFNAWESVFAAELFVPFHRREQTVCSYDAWLLKFCVSISWRVLAHLREQGLTRELEADFQTDVDAALAVWSEFLLDQRPDIGDFEQHLIPAGPIAETDNSLPEYVQRYLMRAVEIDRLWTQESAMTFAKMGRFVLAGFIREPEAGCWCGTRVSGDTGTLAPSELGVPEWFCRELFHNRPQRLASKQNALSPRQRETIARTQEANRDRVMQSETLKALGEDLRLRQQGER